MKKQNFALEEGEYIVMEGVKSIPFIMLGLEFILIFLILFILLALNVTIISDFFINAKETGLLKLLINLGIILFVDLILFLIIKYKSLPKYKSYFKGKIIVTNKNLILLNALDYGIFKRKVVKEIFIPLDIITTHYYMAYKEIFPPIQEFYTNDKKLYLAYGLKKNNLTNFNNELEILRLLKDKERRNYAFNLSEYEKTKTLENLLELADILFKKGLKENELYYLKKALKKYKHLYWFQPDLAILGLSKIYVITGKVKKLINLIKQNLKKDRMLDLVSELVEMEEFSKIDNDELRKLIDEITV